MAVVGQLLVNLRANTASYARDLKKAKRISFDNAKEIKRSLTIIGKAVAGMGVAAAVGFGYFIKQTIDAADTLAKLSRSSGLSVESLSALTHAAELSGISQETLAARMTNLNRRAKEAARGVKSYRQAFDSLGITLTDSQGRLRSTEDLLMDIADGFSKMKDGAMKAALATDIFSNQGVAMIPFLNEGREGLERLKAEAEELGVVIDTKTALAAERFNDSLEKMQKSMKGVVVAATTELLPALALLAGGFESLVREKGLTGALMEFSKESSKALVPGQGLLTFIGKLGVAGKEAEEALKKLSPPSFVPGMDDGSAAVKAFRANIIYVNDALLQHGAIMQEISGRAPTLLTFEEMIAQAMADLAEESVKAGVAIDEGIASDVLRRKTKEYRDALDTVKEKTKEITRASEDMAHVVGTAFEDAILRGEGLRDVFKGLLEDITRIMLRMAITKPLEGLFGPKGVIGSFLGGLFGGVFGGGREHGGPVEPGKAYVVGEGGVPEIFMPDARGKIIPMKQGAGMVINYNIDARGAEGATEAKIRRALIATHESAVKQAQRRFADNRRRSA